MGVVVQFGKLRRHCRTSRSSAFVTGGRAARKVINSAETPASRALSLVITADHHSAGIASRCHHFETVQAEAPMSEAIASREAHSSMIERNDASSVMNELIGHLVLKSKAILSQDRKACPGNNPRMSRTDYKRAFIGRVRASRKAAGLTQSEIGQALQIPQDRYKQYETRSYLPHDLIPGFCLACSIDPGWLFTGRTSQALPTRRRPAA